MPDAALRVAVLSELPTPYRWPLFRRVAADPSLDVTVLYYARTEADRDWALDVPAEGSERPRVEYLPGRALHVRGKRSLFFHWNPGVADRLRRGAFDVVVIPGWSMPTSVRAALWCRGHGTPYVVFSETHALRRRPLWIRATKAPLVRAVVGGASAWLATGTLAAEYLAAHGADPDRIRRFANTPDVEALTAEIDAARPRRASVRAAEETPADAVVCLFVGRLIGAKDAGTLLEAWGVLERRGGAPWLWLVGDGPEAKSLRDHADRLKLARVRFLGGRRPPELPEIWAAADLFALPSRHEPWGAVVNEAMCAGLPLILSDRVGAAPDLLVHGSGRVGADDAGANEVGANEVGANDAGANVNGRLVAAGDAAAVAAAAAEIAGDADLRARMGAASRRRIAGWGYASSVRGFVEAVRLAAGRNR